MSCKTSKTSVCDHVLYERPFALVERREARSSCAEEATMNSLRPSFRVITTQLASFQSVLYEQVRGNVRWYFEKCSEVKRIRKYGWKKRLSTPGGRMIIMRRILKGRHILTH